MEKARTHPDYDVVVVGGGFSGCVAASELARNGFSTAVLERRKETNRETRSGNLISAHCFEALDPPLPSIAVPVEREEHASFKKRSLVRSEARASDATLYAVKRGDLDRFLSGDMQAAGVCFIDDFSVESINTEGAGPASVSSGRRTVTARAVVLASGTEELLLLNNGLLKRKRNTRRVWIAAQKLFHRAASACGVSEGAYLLKLSCDGAGPHAEGWILFLENEVIVTVFSVVHNSTFSRSNLFPDIFFDRIKTDAMLEQAMRSCAPASDWRIKNLGTFPPLRRKLHADRLLVTGDAARPMGGSWRPGAGFSWALYSAQKAASLLSRLIPENKTSRHYLRKYAELLLDTSHVK